MSAKAKISFTQYPPAKAGGNCKSRLHIPQLKQGAIANHAFSCRLKPKSPSLNIPQLKQGAIANHTLPQYPTAKAGGICKSRSPCRLKPKSPSLNIPQLKQGAIANHAYISPS